MWKAASAQWGLSRETESSEPATRGKAADDTVGRWVAIRG